MIARRTLMGGLSVAVLGGSSWAQTTVSSEDARTELDTALPQYRLIGKGRLTVWGFQVYDARLWALPGFKPDNLAGQPFALELAYLRNFSSKDTAERSITEMRRSAAISESQASTWLAELQRDRKSVV